MRWSTSDLDARFAAAVRADILSKMPSTVAVPVGVDAQFVDDAVLPKMHYTARDEAEFQKLLEWARRDLVTVERVAFNPVRREYPPPPVVQIDHDDGLVMVNAKESGVIVDKREVQRNPPSKTCRDCGANSGGSSICRKCFASRFG